MLYLKLLSTYNICIIYLHVTKACLKVTIVIFYFCHSKNLSDVMKYIFNSISIYFWKKKFLLTNIRNKSVIRKINLYFFDVMKNGHIFPSKVCHFQYDHGFLFSRETGNIREYKEVRLKMKNHLKRAFPSHFRQNVFIDTSNVSYLALWHFLMSSSLKIQSTLKDAFSITFSNNNSQRRNIYFEGLLTGLYNIWRPPYPVKYIFF